MSRWSLRIGSLLGVPLYIHWTFLLLIGWLLAAPLFSGADNALAVGLRTTAFVLAIFGCVVLHELGHALAARRFGIATRDITLLPIGGVARLERMPEKPSQELVVAIAGPLVNVAIAALIIPIVLATHGTAAFSGAADGSAMDYRINFLASLGAVNVFLVLFNLIPAFPMDGGRVLRAILAMLMDRVTATRAAAAVGQVIAVLFAIIGLFTGHVLLMLVALFVFMAAGAEAQAEQFRSALRGLPVRAAMMRRFVSLRASDTLRRAAEELLAGSQQDSLVLADDPRGDDDAAALVGILTRSDLTRALAAGKAEAPVASAMRPACAPVYEDDDLQTALARSSARRDQRPAVAAERASPEPGAARPPQDQAVPPAVGDSAALGDACPVLAVVSRNGHPGGASGRGGGGRIVGLVTPENLTELVMIRTATG